MGFFTKRWPFFLILFAVLIALSPALKPGVAIGPWDDLRAMMEGKPTPRAFDVLQMDAALQFYGWRDLVFESWGKFQPPYWNPYQLMGTPLLANSQSGGFYPLHILVGMLHVPTAVAILLLAVFHLAWAGFGVRSLVLRMGGPESGAAVAGALFAVSPFMLSWVGLASVPTTCAWIPWALVFCHDAFDPGRKWAKSLALLGLCLGMMLLGGHLQFAAYGFMAVGVFSLWQAVALRRAIGLAVVLGGCVLGGLLAAPQILPVLEYSKFGHRQKPPTEGGYGFYLRGAVTPMEAMGVVFPDALGTPGRAAPVEGSPVKFGSFWPAYTKIGGNYAESALYLGPAIVALLLLALFRRGWRQVGGIASVGVFGLLLALGTPLDRLFYFELPGWSATGSPGRAAFMFVLAACAVAGWGWPREGDRTDIRKLSFGVVLISLATLTTIAIYKAQMTAWNPALQAVVEEAYYDNMAFALKVALFTIALTIASLVALNKGRPVYACVGLLLAMLVTAGPRLVVTGQPLEKDPGDPNVRTAFVNADWQLLIGLPVVEPPNTATLQRQYDVAGYDSLIHKDTFLVLNEINGKDSAPESNGNMTLVKPGYDKEKLAEAGVTRIIEPGGSTTALSGTQALPARALVREAIATADGGTYTGWHSATVESDTLSNTTVLATGPGTLVLRDRNMPGWTATLDGAPVQLSGERWREVELPAGQHAVAFSYTPPGLKTGLWCLLAGLLGLFACGALARPGKTQ